jgi:hypothetical protein
VGILSLSYHQLLAHITVIFGAVRDGDVFYIKNHVKKEFTSFAAFRDFINQSKFPQLRHSREDSAPHQRHHQDPQRCPQFDIPIGTWKYTITCVSTRTYNDLVKYISAQYSSLSPDTPSRGGTARRLAQNNDPSTIIHGQRKNRKRRRGKGDKGKAKVRETTLSANGSNRHRKLTPPPNKKTTQENRNTAMVGKTKTPQLPWPVACTNGPHHIRLIHRI